MFTSPSWLHVDRLAADAIALLEGDESEEDVTTEATEEQIAKDALTLLVGTGRGKNVSDEVI